MLRALTSYLFGNIQEETPEAPVECETREVNDWLVVNLPNQTKSCINLDDEVDLNEDDILMSVSVLMQSDGLSDESMYICGDVNDGVIDIPYENSDSKNGIEASYGQLVVASYPIRNPRIETAHEFIETVQEMQETCPLLVPDMSVYHGQISILESSSSLLKSFRNTLGLRIETFKQPLVIKNTGVTCAPKYSKSYVNHRHPNHSQKTDLIQRIKELEPEQKALQRITNKNLSKGQIHRQNKNYIYENSSKKHRRSKIQWNRSGANNSRRC